MPLSPWFYTNLPQYDKNWMWPSKQMNLWSDRWTEVLWVQPEYVEITSWNDFGESHYIGTQKLSPPFESGEATFHYVSGQNHEGYRLPLAVWAQQYKTGKATVTEESLMIEYLLHDISCDDADTTINTHTQYQYEYLPSDVLIQAYSLPVAMAQQAISSMKQVKSIGKTEEEEEQKALVLEIVTTVLALVPFVAEAGAAAAGLTAMARAIALVGEAANAAFSIYNIVEDPDNLLMGILGLLMGAGAVVALTRDGESFAKMRALRREGSDDLSSMGTLVDDQASSIQKIISSCEK